MKSSEIPRRCLLLVFTFQIKRIATETRRHRVKQQTLPDGLKTCFLFSHHPLCLCVSVAYLLTPELPTHHLAAPFVCAASTHAGARNTNRPPVSGTASPPATPSIRPQLPGPGRDAKLRPRPSRARLATSPSARPWSSSRSGES